MKRIYMDHGATTPMDQKVTAVMMEVMSHHFGNPSAVYEEGRKAKRIMEDARKQIAFAIGAKPSEIFFTAGGTESDNWAIKGIAEHEKGKTGHIITTAVEHHALLHSCDDLQRRGFDVTFVPVDGFGMVDPDDIEKALRPDTCLISVMTANNEVGTIQPVEAISQLASAHGIPFHTDAVQALGTLAIDVKTLGVDAMSFSAHKIYGPKGVGALYIKQGTHINSFVHGGAQEHHHRAGTENVPGIAGFGAAAAIVKESRETEAIRLTILRDRLINGVLSEIPKSKLNGHSTRRLPGNAHFVFEGIDSGALLMRLDMAGVSASAGSACTAGDVTPSHVLRAMGISSELAKGSLRLTIGRSTTEEEIDTVIRLLGEIVYDLRR